MKISIPTTSLLSVLGVLLTAPVFATENPYFENNIITIPSLDIGEQQSAIQDVKLKRTHRNNWTLLSFERGREIQGIRNIELIQTNEFPVQVFVKIAGEFSNGCKNIGQIATQVIDNRINISIFYNNENLSNRFCTLAMVPFSKTILLPVYGLEAGTYDYTVNHNFTGAFTLTKNNYFQDNIGNNLTINLK